MISKLKISDLNTDEIKNIKNIISTYYIEPEELINKIFSNNDNIYVIYRNNKIASFFMTGIKKVKDMSIIHLGLSGSDKKYSKADDIRSIWKHFLREINLEDKKLIVYSTTTSPFIFNSSFNLFPRTQPDKNFKYSEKYIDLRDELANVFNWKTNDDYPFVLKSFARRTLYNEKESDRLKQYSKRYQLDFLKFGCNENNGDRILLIHNP